MENLQEKNIKSKTKFESNHEKVSVFLRKDQFDYLTKNHIDPNNSSMSLVVRNAIDVFIEQENKNKIKLLKEYLGDGIFEKLNLISNKVNKNFQDTLKELIESNSSFSDKLENESETNSSFEMMEKYYKEGKKNE